MGFGDDHHLRSHRGQNVLAPLRRWVQRRARRPESALRAAQDPTASIQAVPDALAVAESLLGSAPLVCGAYWGAVTVRPLAALLYAAGPNGDGGGIGWVNLAVENVDTGTTTPGWDRAAEICGCADDPAAAGLARAVRGAAAMSSRQRFSICYTMREAIAPWLPHTAGVSRP